MSDSSPASRIKYYVCAFLGHGDGVNSRNTGCYPPNPDTQITSRLPQKFTGKERDAETRLDYFGARYYSAAQGRWLIADWSPVPAPVPYANMNNPQTLNLYQYVGNNPTTIRDVDGHCWPVYVCAHAIMDAVTHAREKIEQKVVALGNPALAGYVSLRASVAEETINMVVSPFTAGEASGRVWDSGNTKDRVLAGVDDTLKVGALAGTLAGAASVAGKAASSLSTTTVTHFTSDAGVEAISQAGELRAGTFVTKPNQIPSGSTAADVERILEIGPGKGSNSITLKVPKADLMVPGNGAKTSGGAIQYQLKRARKIDPSEFERLEQ